MTEEEYFRKNYPDSCYGDRPLSPYWDFFEEGVEFGERQSEKKIEELKEKHKQEILDLVLSNSSERAELEKENAELNNFIMQSKKDGISPINALIIKNLGNQLTKATEIIKTLAGDLSMYSGNYQKELLEAEQFIKEIEK